MDSLESWEYDVLGIYNPNRLGPLDFWYKFLRERAPAIDGDVLEAGVYRGRSLLTSAIVLNSITPEKSLYGFDSFDGFPNLFDIRDEPRNFRALYEKELISKDHYERVCRNLKHLEFLNEEKVTSRNISSSGDFSKTSADMIMNKANYLGLKNIHLIEGNYEETMEDKFTGKLCAVMIDCDLYTSYEKVLNFTWDRLSKGGMVYLDEYYSLKFPGARLAVNDFFKKRKSEFYSQVDEFNGFERWWIIKP